MATDYADKYHYDIYFRTKTRVIGLELLFFVIICITLSIVASHKYEGMPRTIADILEHSISQMQTADLIFTALLFLSICFLFGYVVAHIALKPTRDSLSSQKQFIGNIAHELRTPLSIIKTNMEVVLMDGRMNEKLRESLLDNVDELDRTSDIINNLLSFNTLLNPQDIPFGNVDLGHAIERAREKLTSLAREKNIEMTLTKGEFLIVRGNVAALEQIIMNIVKNALIYTEKGGRINMFVHPNYRGYIEFSVMDSGIGIAQEELSRIFEPFYRAEQSRTRKQSGSGLGLTIVSELVKLHSGKISIKSKTGRGTAVLISIPCGHISATIPLEEQNDDVVSRDYSKRKNPAQTPQ